jgi:methylenetetrahydrofolate dehydrogenase (NADP+)/methenyltetrahydrofolate cyclohydrolase
MVTTTDESTAWYLRAIAGVASRVGIRCDVVNLGGTADGEEIRAALRRLNDNPAVHGIILQTPLPPGVSFAWAAAAIDPGKDVDGANPTSLGRLAAGLPSFPPATARAVVALLEHYDIPLAGRDAVVVGRSTVVGKPLVHLLLDRDATVTVCHSRTANLVESTRRADVLIAAVGRAGLIGSEHVGPGCVVIDVGTNATADGGLVGDVDPAVEEHAAGLTPVPGGVGPVTTALLLEHTVRAAEKGSGQR